MHSKKKVIEILIEIANFLEPYGVRYFPSHARHAIEELEAAAEPEVPILLRGIREGLFRGLNDLFISQKNGHNVSDEEELLVNQKFDALLDKLFEVLES